MWINSRFKHISIDLRLVLWVICPHINTFGHAGSHCCSQSSGLWHCWANYQGQAIEKSQYHWSPVFLPVIYQTQPWESVSPNFQTLRSGFEKKNQGAAKFLFQNHFLMFGNYGKHSSSCLIQLLKPLIILGDIQRKSSLNFKIIKITLSSPNLFHGSVFSHELPMSLRNINKLLFFNTLTLIKGKTNLTTC